MLIQKNYKLDTACHQAANMKKQTRRLWTLHNTLLFMVCNTVVLEYTKMSTVPFFCVGLLQ